ncbi:MAG TPA: hypothetical protein VLH84_04825 [Patescibacteria group bacterium]|nr:hypothetical protein [Patescibacteria group bacterium]
MAKLRFSRRTFLMTAAVAILVAVLITLWVVHLRPAAACDDKGVIGYCCQEQQRQMAHEGKQPDYVCPG